MTTRRTKSRSHPKSLERGMTTIICRTPLRAHAVRHELDKMGALSRRHGKVVRTTALRHQIASACRRAKRSAHHGHTR